MKCKRGHRLQRCETYVAQNGYLLCKKCGASVRRATKVDSFYSYIDYKSGGCWLWTTSVNDDGYALLRGKTAHRFAYELLVGAIPRNREIDHLCNVKHCVNPKHMEIVTHLENIRRSWERGNCEGRRYRLGNMQAAKTQCPHGHPYSGKNLVIDPSSGARRCKICETAKFHRYQRKQKRKVA